MAVDNAAKAFMDSHQLHHPSTKKVRRTWHIDLCTYVCLIGKIGNYIQKYRETLRKADLPPSSMQLCSFTTPKLLINTVQLSRSPTEQEAIMTR